MLRLTKRLASADSVETNAKRVSGRVVNARPPVDDFLVLPFDLRQRSRLLATTETGREVGLFLARGAVLRDGDLLASEEGVVVRVKSASEECSTVLSSDRLALARAAYHLGNRHVRLQIGDGFLRYLHDHVLDRMIGAMGLQVRVELVPFEPEPGAYPGAHSHDHGDHTHAADQHEHPL